MKSEEKDTRSKGIFGKRAVKSTAEERYGRGKE